MLCLWWQIPAKMYKSLPKVKISTLARLTGYVMSVVANSCKKCTKKVQITPQKFSNQLPSEILTLARSEIEILKTSRGSPSPALGPSGLGPARRRRFVEFDN